MSDATNALLELRAKIEANKKLLEKQEQALLIMEEMMGLTTGSNNQTKSLDFYSDGIDVKSLNANSSVNRKTFKQEVSDVVKLFKDQEFSVAHVHEALTRVGYVVKGAQPRARIALVLNELLNDGLLKLTFKGAGSVPNRFVAVSGYDLV